MGSQKFFLDDGEAHIESVVLPPRELRRAQEALAQETTRISGVAADQYKQTGQHFAEEVEFAERISATGAESVAEVLEEMRRGEITPKEAARQVAEMRKDLNKGREALKNAVKREESIWSEVNTTPAEYQRALARRAPQLFSGGRGLLELPTPD